MDILRSRLLPFHHEAPCSCIVAYLLNLGAPGENEMVLASIKNRNLSLSSIYARGICNEWRKHLKFNFSACRRPSFYISPVVENGMKEARTGWCFPWGGCRSSCATIRWLEPELEPRGAWGLYRQGFVYPNPWDRSTGDCAPPE